jgi:hypothetical protein
MDSLLWIDAYIIQLTWIGQFGANRPYITLKHLSSRKYSVSTNSILTGKECAIWCIFKLRCFLWKDTAVCSTELNGPIWSKESLFPPWNIYFVWGIPFKTNTILTGKQCARCWFSLERCMCFFTLAHRPIWKQISLSLSWKLRFAGSIPFKTNSNLTGKWCASWYCSLHRWVSFERYMCFFHCFV